MSEAGQSVEPLLVLLSLCRTMEDDLAGVREIDFANNGLLLDAISYRVLALGETVRDLPDTMLNRWPGIDWRRAVSMRNFLAHHYDDIVPSTVWGVATARAPEIAVMCRAELAALGVDVSPAPAPDILAEFRDAGALLEGHFILSSGLRSAVYLQCARVLMDPRRAERLARALVRLLPHAVRAEATAVIAPAMGGVICGHELARALGVDSMFVERPTGSFELRRGFTLNPGQPVIMMEDVVTTGLSSREAIAAIHAAGGRVIHAACLVDRSDGAADLGVPLTPLLRLAVPSYAPDALPPELAAIPPLKPGSRA